MNSLRFYRLCRRAGCLLKRAAVVRAVLGARPDSFAEDEGGVRGEMERIVEDPRRRVVGLVPKWLWHGDESSAHKAHCSCWQYLFSTTCSISFLKYLHTISFRTFLVVRSCIIRSCSDPDRLVSLLLLYLARWREEYRTG